MQPVLLSGLSKVADKYDAILCDVWGVLHDGRSAFVGAGEALQHFRAQKGVVILITNAPVPKHRVVRLFEPLGVPLDAFDDVVTSGDATRRELRRFAPGPVYVIGAGEDEPVYEGLRLTFSDEAAEARVVCCTGLREYPGGDPETYRSELEALADQKLPMICANPDVQFRHGDRLIWAAGALARMYEEMGGAVIRPGKPDRAIYEVAMERAEAAAGAALDRRRVLAIGDGPATDLLGAQREGIDALFVLHGIVRHRMTAHADVLEVARSELAAEGVGARYVMAELGW